jgi:hypothetical protein
VCGIYEAILNLAHYFLNLETDSPVSIEELFGTLIKNKSSRAVELEAMSRTLFVPPKSTFLMSDLSNVKPLAQGLFY